MTTPGPTRARPELLAPAGSMEAAFAALHFGADAIYLGLRKFSARAEAENLTLDQLPEVVGYAHSLHPPRRVYVTLNTLILDDELPEASRTLLSLERTGVDAVILQDLGLYRLIRRFFPKFRLHASTQMAIHNLPGALEARDLGFARVTLARELTLADVRSITRAAGIETEVFVHGALCYAYSGLCLFSSHVRGRSGNRGRCAYPCREIFREEEGSGLPFSMKDLAVGPDCRALAEAGVSALKIEGRMKSALYVAAVTRYYRGLLDGTLSPDDTRRAEEDIMTLFSRPWTSLYLSGRQPREPVIDPVNVGHRGSPIGRILGVRRDHGADWLALRSRRALERHDGLQIVLPEVPKPYGFAVREMRLRGSRRRLVRVEADQTVEVRLPADHPPLPTGATVYCAASSEVKVRLRYPRPRPGVHRARNPVAISVQLSRDRLDLMARMPGADEPAVTLSVPGRFPPTRDPRRSERAICDAFGRLGATEWRADSVVISNPEGLLAPPSILNEARRRLAAELTAWREKSDGTRLETIAAGLSAPLTTDASGHPPALRWSIKVASAGCLDLFDDEDCGAVDEVVLELGVSAGGTSYREIYALAERFGASKIRLALPPVLRDDEAPSLQRRLASLWREGYRRWEVGHLYGVQMLRAMAAAAGCADLDRSLHAPERLPRDIDLVVDWPCYSLNRLAVEHWLARGAEAAVLSPEDTRSNLLRLLSLAGCRLRVPYFQFTPLFLSAAPPQPWGPPRRPLDRLKDRDGREYRVIRRGRGLTVITSAVPFSLARHRKELVAAGARHLRVDWVYSDLTAEAARDLFRKLRAGGVPEPSHDGNYERGLP